MRRKLENNNPQRLNLIKIKMGKVQDFGRFQHFDMIKTEVWVLLSFPNIKRIFSDKNAFDSLGQ